MVYEYQKDTNGNYVCIHCNVVKNNQSTMHMHYKANHDGALKHKCKDCVYETSTKQGLDKHIDAKHPESAAERAKTYNCPSCEFESLTKAGLRSHYSLRHLSKEVNQFLEKTGSVLSCKECSQTFASKPSYIYHLAGCLPPSILCKKEVREGLGLDAI